MFLHVTKAKHVEGYKVEVSFNNGQTGIADLSTVLKGPVFAPLRELEAFAQFHVDEELATNVWPNGADLAPEYLYFIAFKTRPDLQSQFRRWGYIA